MSDQPKSKPSVDKAELLNTFLTENKIKLKPGIDFPLYKKVPVEVELALEVLNKHEATIVFEVVDEDSSELKETPASA